MKLFVCCVSLILARDKVERRMLSPPSTNVSRKSDCMGERRDYRTSMSCLSLHEKRGIEEKQIFRHVLFGDKMLECIIQKRKKK